MDNIFTLNALIKIIVKRSNNFTVSEGNLVIWQVDGDGQKLFLRRMWTFNFLLAHEQLTFLRTVNAQTQLEFRERG